MPFPERVVGAGYVDAHNAVRAALGMSAVPHPADLFPHDLPEIVDAKDDQLGTTAQDILTGDFSFDPDAEQVVYTLTLADLSNVTPNARWTLSSKFGDVTVFVTAAIDELGAASYSYGRVVPLATGTPSQETLGPADGGSIVGDQVVVRLAVARISAAAGFDVLYTTSTSTEAKAQILIGSTLSPRNLLFNADSAAGSEFQVGERPQPAVTVSGASPVVTTEDGATETFNVALAARPTAPVVVLVTSSRLDEGQAQPATLTFDAANWSTPQTVEVRGRDDMSRDGDVAYALTLDPSSSTDADYAALTPVVVEALNLDNETGEDPPESGKFTERYSGTFSPTPGLLEVPFDLRRTSVSGTLQLSPRANATFTLVDGAGHVIDQSSHGKVQGRSLVPGRYVYRISASLTQPTDVTITSVQAR